MGVAMLHEYHSGVIHSTLKAIPPWVLYNNPLMIFHVAWPHLYTKYYVKLELPLSSQLQVCHCSH